MRKYHPTIEVAVAKGETEAVAELAQVKGQPLGVIDPVRIEQTIEAVNSVFKLRTPVTVNNVLCAGFCRSVGWTKAFAPYAIGSRRRVGQRGPILR